MLEIGQLAGGYPTRPFGINDDGAVVGQGNAGTTMHAFVWLPAPLYGFNCRGPHDLHALAPGTPAGNSIGYEINKIIMVSGPMFHPAGQIAGQVPGTGQQPFDGFVWTLVNGGVTTTNLGQVTIAARAINDANPAVVVGDMDDEADCQGQSFETTVGFRATLSGSVTLEALAPLDDDTGSFASDVSTAPTQNAVGYSDETSPLLQCVGLGACFEERDALIWGVSPPTPTALDSVVEGWGAVALGINNAGDIVGWSLDHGIPMASCTQNATLWRAANHEVVNLGNKCLTTNSKTLANAVADINPLQVVGSNQTTFRAALWVETPGCDTQWTYLDLDAAACDCANSFILREALDINDRGWIVARSGNLSPSASDRAYLLRPIDDCPPDLNGDGFIDVNDLLLLLGQPTGLCNPCTDLCCACLGDLNGDCRRDGDDVAALLGSWGGCPGFEPCAAGEESGGPSLEQSVAILGFESVGALQSWLTAASDDETLAMGFLLVEVLSE